MLHKTVNNRVLLSIKDGISGDRKTQYGILIDDDHDGYGSSISEYNLEYYEIIEKEVPDKEIFNNYVSYFKKDAYFKLKEIGFKL